MHAPDPRPVEKTTTAAASPGGGRWRAVVATLVILGVFSGAVAWTSLELRARWRAQVLQREGDVLHAVALMQQAVVADMEEELGVPSVDPALEVALHTSQMRGVVAVRLFETDGAFRDAVPDAVDEAALSAVDGSVLAAGRPVVRFHPAFRIDGLILDHPNAAVLPMLEVVVPLPAPVTGFDDAVLVQYWISGLPVAEEFARLEARVARQAGIVFAAGVALIGGLLFWAFRRLDRANRLLRARADDLARANRELAQSARTSAIGAITAHLMHGLRNPLAGLEDFVAGQAGAEGGADGGEWASARESTQRLRAIINEVQAVLRDVHDGAEFEISAGEICAGLCERLQPLAARGGGGIEILGAKAAPLGAREAGLGGLVLANLAQNALEASPRGRRVTITVTVDGDRVCFDVADEGGGLPAEVQADPFRPRRSTKPDGAGIGLAISRELARHAGGELDLVRSTAAGTVFRLRLPAAVPRAVRHQS